MIVDTSALIAILRDEPDAESFALVRPMLIAGGAAMAFERITIDHAKMDGLPCIRSLRIPVSTVLGQLAAGRTESEILADFPDLEAADIPAALECAAAAVQERHLPLASGQ